MLNTREINRIHYYAAVHRQHRTGASSEPGLLDNIDANALRQGIGMDGYPIEFPENLKEGINVEIVDNRNDAEIVAYDVRVALTMYATQSLHLPSPAQVISFGDGKWIEVVAGETSIDRIAYAAANASVTSDYVLVTDQSTLKAYLEIRTKY